MRILLVEDDELLVNVLTKSLNARNYSVDNVGDGVQAWEYLSTIDYDLIILDVLLPNLDGVSLCRRLRADQNDTPILILTAQNHSQAKVRGLDAGADDYLAKPFDIEELMARIRALLRRRGGDLFPVLQFGGLLLDPAQCSASYQGIPLPLSTKEYALLELFLHNPQHVFSISEILDSLWSSDEYPVEATVRSHIRRLRNRLIKTGAPKDFIANVHGRGYFLKFQVEPDTSVKKIEVINERQFALQNLPTQSTEQQFQAFLAETWLQFQPKFQASLSRLQETIASLRTGQITQETAQNAYHIAHRLAGTISLFHQGKAQEAAQRLEAFFESLTQSLKLGAYPEVRSRFEMMPTYLTHSSLEQNIAVIQSIYQAITPTQANHHCTEFIVLNCVPDLTQALEDARHTISCPLSFTNTLENFRERLTPSDVGSKVLIIPFSQDRDFLEETASQLLQVKQQYPDLLVIGVSNPVDFEARLQAVKLGINYILDATEDPNTLLKQMTEFACSFNHQTHALLVDDDETWLQIMAQKFHAFGCQVTTSSAPEQFWDVLESCQPNLLILDIKMPRVNGFELCRVLRSHPDWQSLPVIFVSTAADTISEQDGIAAGADELISKQMNTDLIIRRVLNRLRRYSLGLNHTRSSPIASTGTP